MSEEQHDIQSQLVLSQDDNHLLDNLFSEIANGDTEEAMSMLENFIGSVENRLQVASAVVKKLTEQRDLAIGAHSQLETAVKRGNTDSQEINKLMDGLRSDVEAAVVEWLYPDASEFAHEQLSESVQSALGQDFYDPDPDIEDDSTAFLEALDAGDLEGNAKAIEVLERLLAKARGEESPKKVED